MNHYNTPKQSWSERAEAGTPAAQPAQTGVPQPVYGSQPAQTSQFVGTAVEPEPAQPRATRQFASQPVQQPRLVAPQQVEMPRTQQPALPAAGPRQQLPARTEWAQEPTTQFVQTAPTQQTADAQAAGTGTTGAGQATGRTQPTGGEQATAAASAAGTEQQSEVTSLSRGMPSVDIYETPDELVVFADVPGCTPDDIELLANESSVTLVAARGEPSISNGKSIQRERVGEVERTIALPARAEVDGAEATVDDGVCRITLPKSEDDRAKRIGIQ